MKQYTVYTTEGVAVHIRAECFEKQPQEVVFYVGDKVVDRYPRSHVIVVQPKNDQEPVRHPDSGHAGSD